MTARNALYREPRSAPGSVSLDRFNRIGRARWIVAACCRQERPNEELVSPDHTEQYESHHLRREPPVTNLSTSSRSPARNPANERSYAPARAQITMSIARLVGRTSTRTSSRSRLFNRFRSTALCPNRGTMIPTRVDEKGEGLTRAISALVVRVLPSFRIRCSSWRRVIRAAPGYLKDHAAAYFDGSFTTRRLRPFFRRRLRTSRPHRVSIRARNPCVRMRRLFRGRYVGLPIHSFSRNRRSHVCGQTARGRSIEP
jgi:hypothetical protein